MLSIKHLLNPEPEPSNSTLAAPLLSPVDSAFRNSTSPIIDSTPAPSQVRRRRARTTMVDQSQHYTPQVVNYAPFEFSRPMQGLTTAQQAELNYWHKQFKLKLCKGRQGLLRDNARHIAYKSDKVPYFNRVGRDGFNVFEYTFNTPADGKEWTVMWEYETGLVRAGTFFKACQGHNKSTINSALKVSPGLLDVTPSVTGGTTDPSGAQGYWVPFECARAVCVTFCHEVRWVLTPIFGYSIIADCYGPRHPKFQVYTIDPRLVEQARRDEQRLITSKAALSLPASPESLPADSEATRSSQSTGWTAVNSPSSQHKRGNDALSRERAAKKTRVAATVVPEEKEEEDQGGEVPVLASPPRSLASVDLLAFDESMVVDESHIIRSPRVLLASNADQGRLAGLAAEPSYTLDMIEAANILVAFGKTERVNDSTQE